jgi:putative ABC transport system substrate-binding protein
MKRSTFITVLAGVAVAWPLVAIAQAPTAPVIGFLGAQSPDPQLLAKFHQGLNEFGYVQDRNVGIEYRWAFNQNQQLGAMAVELVQHRVALIVATGGMVAAKAAKDATTTIPILFVSGLDPVANGLVPSLSRPGGNVTGVSLFHREIIPKRLEVLKQLAPEARKVAYLLNDDGAGLGRDEKLQIEAETHMASELGLVIHYARNEREIEAAFASMAQQQIEALLVGSDPFFARERALIVALAKRYALPAGYSIRQFADAGGLMSYGPSVPESWRQIGLYAGSILKGTRPEDLPVRLQDKLELVINMKTARTLGLTVAPTLLVSADEIIK